MTVFLAAALSGSALIVVVALLRLALGKHLPRAVFPALWCCAALRLLLPIKLPSSISIWNLASRPQENLVATVQISQVLQPFSAVQNAALTQEATLSPRTVNIWGLIWVLGAVLIAVYFLFGAVRFSRRFARCAPVDNAHVRESLSPFSLWRSPILRCTNDCHAPLTYGIVRPVVLLPADLLCQPEALRMVLLHELTHIRRMDCLRKLLFAVCLCLYWWNPLCWCMVLQANRDIELACDAQTLQRLGAAQKRSYALTLLRLAARQTRPQPLSSAFGRPAVEERIKAIMNMKKLPRYLILFTLVLAATLVTVVATQPQTVSTQSPALVLPQTQSAEDAQSPQVLLAEQTEAALPSPAAPEAAEDQAQTLPVSKQEPPQSASTAAQSGYCFPLENADAIVTNSFGYHTHPVTQKESFHRGTDFAAMEGDNVLAVADGTVVTSEYDEANGYYVLLAHADGTQTGYAHLQKTLVSAGQSVQQGQILGLAGQTGWATGPHLHLDVIVDGEYVDPIEALG